MFLFFRAVAVQLFPKRSEGFSFFFFYYLVLHWVSGFRQVGSTPLLQLSATVRNRSQVGCYGRAYAEFFKSGQFWRFKRCEASFRVADEVFYDVPTCFIHTDQ